MKKTETQLVPKEVSAAKMKQIAKKLNITLPPDWDSHKPEKVKGKKSLEALRVKLTAAGGPIGSDHANPLHGNTHVNVTNPNVTNNSVHLAVHTDTHGNSEPY